MINKETNKYLFSFICLFVYTNLYCTFPVCHTLTSGATVKEPKSSEITRKRERGISNCFSVLDVKRLKDKPYVKNNCRYLCPCHTSKIILGR